MDAATLIVFALAAGAAAGLKQTASSAVTDAYAGLKTLVTKRLGGQPDGALVLARYENAPATWEAPLTAELISADAGSDVELVAAAQRLIELMDEMDFPTGKYVINARGSQGLQIGDGNNQQNTFRQSMDRESGE